MMMKQ